MKIFFDTNFVIDLLIREEFKEVSQSLIYQLNERDDNLCLSFLSLANCAYILRKYPKEQLLYYLKKLDEIFLILNNTKEQFHQTLLMNIEDFEDGLQYQTAIDNKCEIIITRNKKHFSFSEIPVFTSEEYLNHILKN